MCDRLSRMVDRGIAVVSLGAGVALAFILTVYKVIPAWIGYTGVTIGIGFIAYGLWLIFLPPVGVWQRLEAAFKDLQTRDVEPHSPGVPYNPKKWPTSAMQDAGTWHITGGVIQNEVRAACLVAGKALLRLPRKQRREMIGDGITAPMDAWLLWIARANATTDNVSTFSDSDGATDYQIRRVAEASVYGVGACAALLSQGSK